MFYFVTELNLSHNQMSKLPDELADLAELERLDISHNAFTSLPHVAYKTPKLAILNAHHNFITGKLLLHLFKYKLFLGIFIVTILLLFNGC